MKINVRYFASIRDITGRDEECIEINSDDINELKTILFKKYPELLDRRQIFFAINEEYYNGQRLKDSDNIAVFPQVSGG
ncbi:MoaD/ThiS family protein [Acidiplasma sp.]|uniref:MoaD/ThiS family protein n=1 Tax=Acidiplasma sp. TaxID=1872114 RepID=UPI002587EA2D|nr:MoaD/ThiS family protein [Acidiplasma sp.]